MGATKKIAVAVLALAACSLIGSIEYSDALIADATEKDARPQRVADPLPYINSASVCQRTYYAERPSCRYYITERK